MGADFQSTSEGDVVGADFQSTSEGDVVGADFQSTSEGDIECQRTVVGAGLTGNRQFPSH